MFSQVKNVSLNLRLNTEITDGRLNTLKSPIGPTLISSPSTFLYNCRFNGYALNVCSLNVSPGLTYGRKWMGTKHTVKPVCSQCE